MHVALMVFLAIVAFCGTIGNIFIIGAVCLQRRLRVRGNAFVINLAVADLLITAYIMPLGLAAAHYKASPFSDTLCHVNAFLIMTSCGVSTQSLMMIAIERYVHICQMTWYRRLFNNKMVAFDVAFCWVYTAVWTAQGWTGWTSYLYGEDVYVCLFDGTFSLSYDICLSAFGMLLPLAVLGFCYFMIFRAVRKTRAAISVTRVKSRDLSNRRDDPAVTEALRKSRRESDREYRLILTLFTIVVIFCVMWTPASVILVISGTWAAMPKVLYTFSVWMAFANSSMNSVVYGVMNKNFRKGYALMFRALFCTNHCARTACWRAHVARGTHRRQADSSGSGGTAGSGETGGRQTTSPDTSVTNASKKQRHTIDTTVTLPSLQQHVSVSSSAGDGVSSNVSSTAGNGLSSIQLSVMGNGGIWDGGVWDGQANGHVQRDDVTRDDVTRDDVTDTDAGHVNEGYHGGDDSLYVPETVLRTDGYLETKM